MLANFSNLITFSRGSNATVTDASGRLTYAPSNVSTNSDTFEAAAWGKVGATVSANITTAPDGTLTADKLVESAANSDHRVFQTVTATRSVFSVYIKAAGRSFAALGTGVANEAAWFNLATGTVATKQSAAVANIQNVGNGWYRCSVVSAGPTNLQIFAADADNVFSYTGDGTSGIFIWGAQLEAVTYQTTPSPYVSTSVANLLGFSEDFTNAAWAKSNTAIVPGAAQNPINNLWNAQKLMEDTATAGHFVNQLVTTVAGVSYTASVYLKAAGRNARLFVYQSASPFTTIGSVTVDLSNGAVLSGAGSVTSVGNGWYRVSVTGAAIDTATRVRVDLAQGVTFSYAGDGNSGIYIYGAQLSNSGSLDPYVPTPGAAPSSTAYYGPRFDYDPVTLAAKGILIEEQRTNLLLRSEEFSNGSAWIAVSGASVSADTTLSPSGVQNADTLTFSATNGNRIEQTSGTAVNAETMTFSVWLRGSGTMRINVGTDTGVGGVTETVINLTSTWTRYSATVTYSSPTGLRRAMIIWRTGDTATSVQVYGAQLEAGAFATSYIPTVASQVTRSADVASITGSLFSQWYRQDEGTFVTQFRPIGYTANSMLIAANDGGTNNLVMQYLSFPTDIRFTVRNATVDQCLIDSTFSASGVNKMASSYAANNFNSVTNGGTVGNDPSGTTPTLTTLGIGNRVGSLFWNGYIQNITYIPNAVSASQLQSATT